MIRQESCNWSEEQSEEVKKNERFTEQKNFLSGYLEQKEFKMNNVEELKNKAS